MLTLWRELLALGCELLALRRELLALRRELLALRRELLALRRELLTLGPRRHAIRALRLVGWKLMRKSVMTIIVVSLGSSIAIAT